jgi:hypothetical protein
MRQHLFEHYMAQTLTFEEMMTQARDLDRQYRTGLFDAMNVKDADYVRKVGEEDTPIRHGSTPAMESGRGIFSDEDIGCLTQVCMDQFVQLARSHGYRVSQNPFYLRIYDLDAKIWWVNEPLPPFDNLIAYHQYAQTIARDPEYALGARPGIINRTNLETVLENITKSQVGLGRHPNDWGTGYHRYEELIQTAKATLRNLEATGLCNTMKDTCTDLKNLRKMYSSPEAMGIFKPGDSNEEITTALVRQQEHLKALMAMTFQKAREQLEDNVKAMNRQLLSPSGHDQIKLAQTLQETIYRIAVRYDILSNQYPELMVYLSGDETPFYFIGEQMHNMKQLQHQSTSASARFTTRSIPCSAKK